MSHEQCSYGDLCERLPLQLIECQEKAACHNLVHHTCQSKHEFEHGFEGAMKIRCRECVDSSLEDMNAKSVQEEGESVGNKAQGGGEIPVDECESDDGITLRSSSDIFSETSSCASDSSSCPPKIDEVDFDLSSWKETSQNFNDIAVSFDDAQESFKSSFRKAQLLLQEKVNAQHFANNTFYECDAHGQSLEENLKLFHVLAPNQLWNKILFFLNENSYSNNSSTNNKKRAVNNDSTEAVASTSQSPSIASTVQISSTTPSPNSNSQCPSPNAISYSPSTDLNFQNTSATSASTIPSTNLNSPSPSTSRSSHSSDAPLNW